METITIQKSELRDLIKTSVRQVLEEIEREKKDKFSFVTEQEQLELEKEFGESPVFSEDERVVL